MHLNDRHHTFDTFMPLVENFVEQLPELTPDVWDITEPFKRPFSVAGVRETLVSFFDFHMREYVRRDEILAKAKPKQTFDFTLPERKLASILNFDWKRKTKPKAWGSFSAMTWGSFTCHANISMFVDTDRKLEASIIAYLKQATLKFNGHYGYFDSMTPEYEEVARANETRSVGISVYSHRLQKKLPDIFWCQVFGAPYVRLFGLEKLLSAPAFKVEQLGPEMVYIQLSESLFDMHERYAEVDAVRQRVKAHLDDNIFFQPKYTENHVYRTPNFQFPEVPTEPKESLL